MEYLQNVNVTFDEGETSVNFAKAAMVLQGGASVYSKKVDFLWQSVLQTMDLLRNKKEGEGAQDDEGGGAISSKGRRKQNELNREFELLVAELGKNINIKTDEDESIHDRKTALNFIYVTPRQLIEKEGSEQKSVKVNLYMGVAQAKWDLLAAKEDFRINGQYVQQTGYLGEELNVDNQYLNLVNDETVGGNNTSLHQVVPYQDHPDNAPSNYMEISLGGGGDDDHRDADVSVTSERAFGQNASSAERDLLASPPPPRSPERENIIPESPRNTTPEPVYDPWEPLNPHEQLSTPKPIKVKKSIKLPPSLKNKNKKSEKMPPLLSISDYLNQEMSLNYKRQGIFNKIPASFADLAYQEYLRRRERDKQDRRDRLSQRNNARKNLFVEDNENANDFENNDNHDNDPTENDDMGADNIDNDPEDDLDDLDLPNPHLGGDVGAFVADQINPFPNDGNPPVPGDESLTYEEMVARKVEEFVTQSQEYMRSSELAVKVANWHEMIGPRLESVEKRNAFDIHAYGSRIINNFSSQQKDIHFNSVVRGQKPEEVSRYYILYDSIEKKIISFISFQVFPFNVNVGEHRERVYLNSRRN